MALEIDPGALAAARAGAARLAIGGGGRVAAAGVPRGRQAAAGAVA